MVTKEQQKAIEDAIHQDLLATSGQVLSRDSLRRALGFPTVAALNKAIQRKKVPIPLFRMSDRQGLFAWSRDVARYIAEQRINGVISTERDEGYETHNERNLVSCRMRKGGEPMK